MLISFLAKKIRPYYSFVTALSDTLPSELRPFFSSNEEMVRRLDAVTAALQAPLGSSPVEISKCLCDIVLASSADGCLLLGPLHKDMLLARQLFVDDGRNNSPVSPG